MQVLPTSALHSDRSPVVEGDLHMQIAVHKTTSAKGILTSTTNVLVQVEELLRRFLRRWVPCISQNSQNQGLRSLPGVRHCIDHWSSRTRPCSNTYSAFPLVRKTPGTCQAKWLALVMVANLWFCRLLSPSYARSRIEKTSPQGLPRPYM